TNFTLAELGICEPSPHRSGYCSDIGILQQGYSLSTGSDADSDTEGGMSPEHAIRLWGRGIKSRRSSGLSSRENSALTLTDSDNDNKSDEENVLGGGNDKKGKSMDIKFTSPSISYEQVR
ncbi:Teneurin-2, partial [Ophiophagus hannah]